jgi:hypothetical protein
MMPVDSKARSRQRGFLGLTSSQLVSMAKYCAQGSVIAWAGFYLFLPAETWLTSLGRAVVFFAGMYVVAVCVLAWLHRKASQQSRPVDERNHGRG